MEFSIALGLYGWALLAFGALVFGVIAQMVGETRTGYEWLIDAVAVALGALIASEFVIGWRTVEPVFDGLAIVPSLVGGIVLGLIVEIATRFLTGGRYMGHSPMAA
jgi:uncharacterized membrane protein YeaQ/YmgE (transglycosylase-associated protein family)